MVAYITVRMFGILESITSHQGFWELGRKPWEEIIFMILSQVPKDSEVYLMFLVKEVREKVNVNYYLETWRTHIYQPWRAELKASCGASYYSNLLYIRVRGGHLHGTVGDIIVQLLHIQKIFYPPTWYSMSHLEFSFNIKILFSLICELFINLKSSYKDLLGISFCTGTRSKSFQQKPGVSAASGEFTIWRYL